MAITLYVDDALGNDSNSGANPGAGSTGAKKTIGAAKTAGGVNYPVTINVADGLYREQVQFTVGTWHLLGTTKAGTIISGAATGHTWTAEAGLGTAMYSIPWLKNWGFGTPVWAGSAGSEHLPFLERREDVFVGSARGDARRLLQVDSLAECQVNAWTFFPQDNASTGKLYMNIPGGTAGRFIEVADRDYCIRLHCAGSIQHLTVEKSANIFENAGNANIRVQTFNGQVLNDVLSRYGSWCGVQLSDTNCFITDLEAEWGGVYGVAFYKQKDGINTRILAHHNNERGWQADFVGWASGNKQSSMRRNTWNYCQFYRNFGGGLWYDLDCEGEIHNFSAFFDNLRFGTWFEASQGPFTANDCRAWGNGMGGFRMNADRLTYNRCSGWNNKKGNWDFNGSDRSCTVHEAGVAPTGTYNVQDAPIVLNDCNMWQDILTTDLPWLRQNRVIADWTAAHGTPSRPAIRSGLTMTGTKYGAPGATLATVGILDNGSTGSGLKTLAAWKTSSTEDADATVATVLDVPIPGAVGSTLVLTDAIMHGEAFAEIQLTNPYGATLWVPTNRLGPATDEWVQGKQVLTQAQMYYLLSAWNGSSFGAGTVAAVNQPGGAAAGVLGSTATKVNNALRLTDNSTAARFEVPYGEFASKTAGRQIHMMHIRRTAAVGGTRVLFSTESAIDNGITVNMGTNFVNAAFGAGSADRGIVVSHALPTQDVWVSLALIVNTGTVALWSSWGGMGTAVTLSAVPVTGTIAEHATAQRVGSRAYSSSASPPIDLKAYARFTDLQVSGGTDGWSSTLDEMLTHVHKHWLTLP